MDNNNKRHSLNVHTQLHYTSLMHCTINVMYMLLQVQVTKKTNSYAWMYAYQYSPWVWCICSSVSTLCVLAITGISNLSWKSNIDIIHTQCSMCVHTYVYCLCQCVCTNSMCVYLYIRTVHPIKITTMYP